MSVELPDDGVSDPPARVCVDAARAASRGLDRYPGAVLHTDRAGSASSTPGWGRAGETLPPALDTHAYGFEQLFWPGIPEPGTAGASISGPEAPPDVYGARLRADPQRYRIPAGAYRQPPTGARWLQPGTGRGRPSVGAARCRGYRVGATADRMRSQPPGRRPGDKSAGKASRRPAPRVYNP